MFKLFKNKKNRIVTYKDLDIHNCSDSLLKAFEKYFSTGIWTLQGILDYFDSIQDSNNFSYELYRKYRLSGDCPIYWAIEKSDQIKNCIATGIGLHINCKKTVGEDCPKKMYNKKYIKFKNGKEVK